MTPNKNMCPGDKCPELKLKTTQDKSWSLADQNPEQFTMIVFYRGKHCPICKSTLNSLNERIEKFNKRKVNVIAVSMDTEQRAKESQQDWGVDKIDIGHSLSEETARNWDLFISKHLKDEEPDVFNEPALMLIKPDQTLYYSSIQNMPFVRPDFDEMLDAIDYIVEKDYPVRGTAMKPKQQAKAA